MSNDKFEEHAKSFQELSETFSRLRIHFTPIRAKGPGRDFQYMLRQVKEMEKLRQLNLAINSLICSMLADLCSDLKRVDTLLKGT